MTTTDIFDLSVTVTLPISLGLPMVNKIMLQEETPSEWRTLITKEPSEADATTRKLTFQLLGKPIEMGSAIKYRIAVEQPIWGITQWGESSAISVTLENGSLEASDGSAVVLGELTSPAYTTYLSENFTRLTQAGNANGENLLCDSILSEAGTVERSTEASAGACAKRCQGASDCKFFQYDANATTNQCTRYRDNAGIDHTKLANYAPSGPKPPKPRSCYMHKLLFNRSIKNSDGERPCGDIRGTWYVDTFNGCAAGWSPGWSPKTGLNPNPFVSCAHQCSLGPSAKGASNRNKWLCTHCQCMKNKDGQCIEYGCDEVPEISGHFDCPAWCDFGGARCVNRGDGCVKSKVDLGHDVEGKDWDNAGGGICNKATYTFNRNASTGGRMWNFNNLVEVNDVDVEKSSSSMEFSCCANRAMHIADGSNVKAKIKSTEPNHRVSVCGGWKNSTSTGISNMHKAGKSC